MSSVNILLDSYQFYAGDIIKGNAVCHIRSTEYLGRIIIRLRGKESTNWISTETTNQHEHDDDPNRTTQVTFHGNRDFLLRDHIVRGEGPIGIGDHTFPFEFLLPVELPSSFQHRYGQINYSVKVTVELQRKELESEKGITIISPLKLQMISSSLFQPVQYSDEKTICCWCCASGPIQLDVSLDKRAFALGENAEIKICCSNMSNVNIESIVVEIKLKLTFKAIYPSTDLKYESEVVAASLNNGVGPHGEERFAISLEIPPSIILPNFTGCELFTCDPELKVNATIAGCHVDLDIKTNVALGHIPLPQPYAGTAEHGQFAPPYPLNDISPLPMSNPMPMPLSGQGQF